VAGQPAMISPDFGLAMVASVIGPAPFAFAQPTPVTAR